MNKMRGIVNEFKYASGPAQFILFGVWTIICSGMFPLSGYLPLLAFVWLLTGMLVIVTTLTLDRKLIRAAILSSTALATTTGSIFFTYALSGGDMRSDMQTPTVALIILTLWGLYLGNLCSRQIWDKEAIK